MAQVRQKAALRPIGGLRRELGVERGLFGEFTVGDQLHRAGQAQWRAVRGAFGLAARPHPFIVSCLVPHAKFQVVNGAMLEVIVECEGNAFAVLRVNQGCELLVRGTQLLDAVAQDLAEAQPVPGDVGQQIDFPQTILRAAQGPFQANFHRAQRRLGALQVADVNHGAGDALNLSRESA